MKVLFLSFFCEIFLVTCFAQKPPIDTSSLGKWPFVANPAISNNGKYATYTIERQPAGSSTLVVRSTSDAWKEEFAGAKDAHFSGDGKLLIFAINDTLKFLSLETSRISCITNVRSYNWPKAGNGKYMAYQLRDSTNKLVLFDLFTGHESHFSSVTDYLFDENGRALLLKCVSKSASTSRVSLRWIDLDVVRTHVVWSEEWTGEPGPDVNSYSFDESGTQLIFLEQRTIGRLINNSICYYKVGMDSAVLQVNERNAGITPGIVISDYPPEFSKNGQWIFFHIREMERHHDPRPEVAKVNIWSYKDPVLQSRQMADLGPKQYLAVVNVLGKEVVTLEKGDEKAMMEPSEICGGYIMISDNNDSVVWWRQFEKKSYSLVSLKNGERKSIKNSWIFTFSYSPTGRYIVYFDSKQKNYFSYDMIKGEIHNISRLVPAPLNEEKFVPAKGSFNNLAVGVAQWLGNDTALLVYDNYDIWQLDPSAKKQPVNITNGYGATQHIKFRLVCVMNQGKDFIPISKRTLLLTAFNPINKCNGFYRKTLYAKGPPELLVMGPYTFYKNKTQYKEGGEIFALPIKPIRARDSSVWIIERMSAIEAPNYFLTRDFRSYASLSDLQPQKAYNWLTAELMKWKQPDGTVEQGILYKPENFDAHKKYPLLIHYYEELSFRLYEYPEPEFTGQNINIPWFVSHGYLVLTPDFHYSTASISGKVGGESISGTVVSAVRYLAGMPWVDNKRLGLQGHSFGGFETNYLVTHTHLFAAAEESCGISDLISAYLGLDGPLGKPTRDRQPQIEFSHYHMGATIWQRPDLYIKHSPVFKADQVTTPLLIMHNKLDSQIPWAQGVEMYLALRRLEKRVWMLEYDDGTHGVVDKDARDYTIRLTQFFDHYLKNAPPPKWMTEGVPARFKGIEQGYELDRSGKTP